MGSTLSFAFGHTARARLNRRLSQLGAALLVSAALAAPYTASAQDAPQTSYLQTITDPNESTMRREPAIRYLVNFVRDKKLSPANEDNFVAALNIIVRDDTAAPTLRSTAIMAMGDITPLRPARTAALLDAILPFATDQQEILRKASASALKALPDLGAQDARVVDAVIGLTRDPGMAVRRLAIGSLSAAAATSGLHAPRFIAAAAPLVTNNDIAMRTSARNILSDIAESYPAQRDDALAPLLATAQQGLLLHRQEALAELGTLGKADAGLTARILPVLEPLVGDGSQEIRKAVMNAIQGAALPYIDTHAALYFRAFTTLIKDSDGEIRKTAVSHLAKAAIASKPHSVHALALMRDNLQTEDIPGNRRDAVTRITDVGDAHNELTPSVMEVLRAASIAMAMADEKAAALRLLQNIATRDPAWHAEIFTIFSDRAADSYPGAANAAIHGMNHIARLDNTYAAQAYRRSVDVLPVVNKSVAETIARRLFSYATYDKTLAAPIMADLSGITQYPEHAVRDAALFGMAQIAIEHQHLSADALRLMKGLTAHSDSNTRRSALVHMTGIGQKVDAQSAPVLRILKDEVQAPAKVIIDINIALTQIGALAEKKIALAPEAVQFLVPIARSTAAGSHEAIRALLLIGKTHASLLPVIVPLLEPLQGRPIIGPSIISDLKKLRQQLDFQVLRDEVNREAELTMLQPTAVRDPALAATLLPDAIILLRSPTATIRKRMADFVTAIGNAHAPLAGDALQGLAGLSDDTDINTRRSAAQGIGKIGLAHARQAREAVAALAVMAGDSDVTIAGMAVTGIGLIGQDYPAAAPDALIALQNIERGDNPVLKRNAQSYRLRLQGAPIITPR